MNAKDKYLGSPLILGHSKQESFRAIKENFIDRLSGWSSSIITQADKSIMVKHVLISVPLYQMGIFQLPKHLINQLTSLQRKYFWGYSFNRGFNPISWSKICKAKDLGG
ncbi:uncharacterized protein LOC113272163 [Papaver somniferum]|uniref:uncharacterized protein LOC113272163 n=1 Tax=Papaver somniferum TaxID=3469 RepID=UPI000E6FB944|nr:uncharacterized protein LOC113272163 [Papaver somniferum]